MGSDEMARVSLLVTAKAEDQARSKISKTAKPMSAALKKQVNEGQAGRRASRYEN